MLPIGKLYDYILNTVPTGTAIVMLAKIMPLTRISEFSYIQDKYSINLMYVYIYLPLMMLVYKFDAI